MKILQVAFKIISNNHGVLGAGAYIAGSALVGGASIGSSLLGGKSGRDAQEEANKLTRELYYADREWNKPINQVARLRAAGLNPNLVYGNGGSVAGNTSKGAPKMESIGGYDVDFAGAINAALTAGAIEKQDKETKNLQKQNESLQQTIDKIKEERRGLKLDNDLKAHDLSVIKNTPTTSKDRGTGAQIVRGVTYLGRKLLDKSSGSDFVRGASDLIIPSSMKGNNKSGPKVDIKRKSNKPWFFKLNNKPWFTR